MARVARTSQTGRFSSGTDGVVRTRELPGKVVVRNLRNDVYNDALRAAESTLRNLRKDQRASAKTKS